MLESERSTLAARQLELIAALTADAAVPENFEPSRVRLAAEMLFNKRRRGVQKSWPKLCEALGAQFPVEFQAFSAEVPSPAETPLADGALFAEFLLRRETLPDAGRIELALYRAQTGARVQWMFLVEAKRWFVAVRLLRVRGFRIP
ncbi:MAG TPA: hypothetical protein VEK08_01175 [Planctomycetota bacterium]|nr:hypothetical protein [Planctomycetota bacterium]